MPARMIWAATAPPTYHSHCTRPVCAASGTPVAAPVGDIERGLSFGWIAAVNTLPHFGQVSRLVGCRVVNCRTALQTPLGHATRAVAGVSNRLPDKFLMILASLRRWGVTNTVGERARSLPRWSLPLCLPFAYPR